ncbi:LOW QUALITY PROTEIN: hypothetical protein DAPPUDRAFT_263888 [Daphnia pulex]|uniref:Uncharacterized protein n=1 Tax=Daphnia pulex TaxID=6669 RepID=E9HQK5_DAPPU|nr:LOW QUALITY PROTEIN: hypothetical protein DAPPUDRAFT_263888 [Daphnia pulex]|eukprot:EFX65987.1 LOW QUALITY PROTEIN: hypothetical protein DAPPUDRAFT_263888 [Daphnia pulex]
MPKMMLYNLKFVYHLTMPKSSVAPGRAAAGLGGTTTSSYTTGTASGRRAAARCPSPLFTRNLTNSKKIPQHGAISRCSPPKILRRPSLPASPAPQPVPPPVQARCPDVIEEPEPVPEPIQAPLPNIVQHLRPVRVHQEHQEQAAEAAAPIEPEKIHLEPQEQAEAAAAPIEQATRAGEHEEESEEDDELQLCHLSSFEGSSDDNSSTDEDRFGFERELERNPALKQHTPGAKKRDVNAATSTLVLATSGQEKTQEGGRQGIQTTK